MMACFYGPGEWSVGDVTVGLNYLIKAKQREKEENIDKVDLSWEGITSFLSLSCFLGNFKTIRFSFSRIYHGGIIVYNIVVCWGGTQKAVCPEF